MKKINLLKGLLKRKIKISETILVSFLITGSVGYALNISQDLVNDSLIINNNGNGVTLNDANLSLVNEGTIAGSNDSGNGIFVKDKNTKNISNGGVIYGDSIIRESGNGILIKNKTSDSITIDSLSNSGLILGNANNADDDSRQDSGNGVSLVDEYAGGLIVNTITNNGVIQGNGDNIKLGYSGSGIIVNATLDTITNSGVIRGNSDSAQALHGVTDSISGLGLYVSKSNTIINSGMIWGQSNNSNSAYSGNGIYAGYNNHENISNSGLVVGLANTSSADYSGNGILSYGAIKNISNDGTILGSASNVSNLEGVGNGLFIKTNNLDKLNNSGIIAGYTNNSGLTNSGIGIGSTSSITNIVNDGIIAGTKITSGNILSYTNNGVEILLSSNGTINSITNGTGQSSSNKNILNVPISGNDSFIEAQDSYDNSIINGAGVNKGALIITKSTSLNNSILNGYKSGVYLEDDASIDIKNTILNAGLYTILGNSGNNTVNISDNSIINGDIFMGDGKDQLTITQGVQINKNLDGGADTDILNLGLKSNNRKFDPTLNIFHEIKNFENININGNITLFETAKITDAENIKLESGNMILRVNPVLTKDNKIIGHALYENSGTISSTGGNLVIGLNGISAGAIVDLGKTSATPETDDKWYTNTDHIKTDSLVLDGKLLESGKEIEIVVLDSIPLIPSSPGTITPAPENPSAPSLSPDNSSDQGSNDSNVGSDSSGTITPVPENPSTPSLNIDPALYEKLNKVYQSIVSAGQIGQLANTTLLEDKSFSDSLSGLLSLLDQVWGNNPYAYTINSTRDSLKLFGDNLDYLTIKPKQDEIIVQGQALYSRLRTNNNFTGKNHFGFDGGSRNYKVITNTTGGIGTLEYGLSDQTSIGLAIGGNRQRTTFKGSTKIMGDALYLGAFAKSEKNNFKFKGGIGYQYTSADIRRHIFNKYNSFNTKGKYDINSLNLFAETKYVYQFNDLFSIEPKIKLNYYHTNQDNVNEGYKSNQLSIKTSGITRNNMDLETMLDFVNITSLNNGILKNIFSIGIINTVGERKNELKGQIIGSNKLGSEFDIQGYKLPRTYGKIEYALETENINGTIYTARINYEFAENNRDLNLSLGIGYKF